MAEGAAIIAGAFIGAATGVYTANQNEEAMSKQYAAQQRQWEAEANAAASNAFASAEAIWATSRSQAEAIMGQAAMERDLFYKEAESARAIAYGNI
jgi:hypothetical protein